MEFASLEGRLVDFALGFKKAPPRPGDITVCARKRPLLAFEREAREWSVVQVEAREAAVLCHDGRLARSGRELKMTHRRYALDRAWGSDVGSEQVDSERDS